MDTEGRLQHTILYKEVEHLWILWESWNQSPVETEGQLYIYIDTDADIEVHIDVDVDINTRIAI